MSLSLARVFARRSLLHRSSARVVRGGGGGGGRMIPFARLAPPTEKLTDDVDLVWDDGVAPEPAVDVELPNVPLSEVVTLQLTFALLILGVWGVCNWLDPADRKPVAPRRLALPTREEMEFDDDHGRAQLD